jgi:hypothetical protein
VEDVTPNKRKKMLSTLTDAELQAMQKQIAAVQRARKKLPTITHGWLRMYDKMQQRYVDEDDDYDAETEYTAVVVPIQTTADKELIRVKQFFAGQRNPSKHVVGSSAYMAMFTHEVDQGGSVCDIHQFYDGGDTLEMGIRTLPDAMVYLNDHPLRFHLNWEKVGVAEGLWRRTSTGDKQAFLRKVKTYGTRTVYVLHNEWMCD